MALALANAGCSLFLVARTKEEIEKVAEEVQKLHSSIKAVAHVADLNAIDQLEELVSTAIEAFGHIDLLVNNAALGTTGPFDTYCMEKVKERMVVHALIYMLLKIVLASGGRCILSM